MYIRSFSSNKLSGEIPKEYSNLLQLDFLYVKTKKTNQYN